MKKQSVPIKFLEIHFRLGDTRSTLNGVICWAIFNVIGKVFPFPSPFLGDLMQKPSNNYSFL